MESLITENLDIWTAAQESKVNGKKGRGKKANGNGLYGIKKLRELILDLAVRGKLVPQDSDDESADVLIKKILKEKASLVKEEKIKRQKKLPKIEENEKPFELPENWIWSRVGDIGYNWGQKKPDSNFSYIEVSGINNDKGEISSVAELSSDKAPSRARKIVKKGSVIYSTVRPYLKNICVIDQDYSPEPIASTAFAVLHPFQKMPGKYFVVYFRSPTFVKYVESVQTGIAYPAINDKQFMNGLVPIPPIMEQHRIIAKVDELMAICDQLEQQQIESNETHYTLVETLLTTLTKATDHDEFIDTWTIISEQFDTLFITEESVDKLKQTMLHLAVMGKLVHQDKNEEPTSRLLEKVTKKKEDLIKKGKLKKTKKLPKVAEEEKQYELPESWEWVRFGELVNIRSELVKPFDFLEMDQIGPDSIEKGTGNLLFRRTVNESGVKGPNNRFYKGQLLYSKIRPSLSKAIIVDFDGLCSADMYPLEPLIDPEFLLRTILSEVFLKQVRVVENRVKMPKLNITDLSSMIVPLPPLKEQNRISEKLKSIFVICDELKQKLQKTESIKIKISDSIVDAMVS